jgi:MFS family permease
MSADNPSWPSPIRANVWLGILVLAYICSFLDRQILSLLIDPIKRDLEISETQFGLLHGLSFALFYCFVGLILGGLVDSLNRKWIIIAGIVGWSIATALCGLAGSFTQLFMARMLVGIGEAALSPAAYSLLADSFPRQRLARAMSIYTAGAGAGAGIAIVLGGSVIQLVESAEVVDFAVLGNVRSWQLVFMLLALLGLPIALAMTLLREPWRQDRSVSAKVPWTEFFRLIRKRSAVLLPMMFGLTSFLAISMGTFTWAPAILLRVYQLSIDELSLILGGLALVATTTGLIGGAECVMVLERRGIRQAAIKVAIASLILTIPAAILLYVASDTTLALIAIGTLLFFANTSVGTAAALLQHLVPNQMRGRMSALYLAIQNGVGMVLGTVVPGLITDHIFGADTLRVGSSLAMTVIAFAFSGVLLLGISMRNSIEPEAR